MEHQHEPGKNPRLCLVSLKAWGAVSGKSNASIGGIARQTALVSKWLAAHGRETTVITEDEGQKADTQIDGITILKTCQPGSGLPGLRFFHPRWTSLLSAIKRSRADVVYQNGSGALTGQIAIYCKFKRIPFVFSVASDADCLPSLKELKNKRDKFLYIHGLKHATQVIVQTDKQKHLLVENFRVQSTVIPMPCPGPADADYVPRMRVTNRQILWVGRICSVKRPELLLKLANRMPDWNFHVVGPAYHDESGRKFCEMVKTTKNVVWHGPVPYEGMSPFYAQAAFMCCTSEYEGFPNTFLEAWSHGLPVISTIDPDSTIERKQLGAIAANEAEMERYARLFSGDDNSYQSLSKNCRRYYVQNHTLEHAMRIFDQVLKMAAQNR